MALVSVDMPRAAVTPRRGHAGWFPSLFNSAPPSARTDRLEKSRPTGWFKMLFFPTTWGNSSMAIPYLARLHIVVSEILYAGSFAPETAHGNSWSAAVVDAVTLVSQRVGMEDNPKILRGPWTSLGLENDIVFVCSCFSRASHALCCFCVRTLRSPQAKTQIRPPILRNP